MKEFRLVARKIKKAVRKLNSGKNKKSSSSSSSLKLSSLSSLKLNANYVMQRTGWDYSKACTEIKEAKKLHGISHRDFSRYEYFDIPKDKWEEKNEVVIQQKQEKKERLEILRREKCERYLKAVMEETGWDRSKAFWEMIICQNSTGMAFEHYAAYKFWNVDKDKQLTYFTKGCADALWRKYNKNKIILQILGEKDKFCDYFSEYLGRKSIPTYRLDFDTFVNAFGEKGGVIFKPSSTSGGRGIEFFEYNEHTLKDTYSRISGMGEGVVEEYIKQHPKMKKMSKITVNTVRLVTVMTKEKKHGIETGKVHFMYAGMKAGTGDAYADNMHAGGLVTFVDVEKGKVITDGVDLECNAYSHHPDTGKRIKGFKIPFFKKAKKLLEKVCTEKDLVGYYGWDIAISKKGPVIIEGNTHPAADIVQTPNVPDGIGMRYVAEPFLKESEIEKPETPYGAKISKMTDAGIEFYWKKPEHADGYEVFRSYSADGDYEHIASIDTRRIGEYTDNSFDREKKKVYYTVCSYKNTIGLAYSYSSFTKPVAAVFREKVEIERENVIMYSGSQRQIQVYYGWGELKDAEWESDNENVATVDSNGIIRAISAGECTVSCKSKEHDAQVAARVYVDRSSPSPLGEITGRYSRSDNGIWKDVDAAETNEAVIMMVGDLMCGKRQMQVQYSEEGGWNFNESFKYIREVISESDLAVCNVETLLASGWPYMIDECYIDNKNNCNAPSRFLDAVKFGGFDVAVLANNHNCDGGVQALIQTIEQVNRYKLINTGIFSDDGERRFVIIDINGIKVGILAYMTLATSFNGKDKNWSKEEKNRHLNIYYRERAERDIKECQAAGAEFIIAYMHWGMKNFLSITEDQQKDAEEIANLGVNYIVGANPHVIQKYEAIRTDDGRTVPCSYSTGNFLSIMNQVKGNRDSVIVRIKLKKHSDGTISLIENNYIPCFCYRKIGDSNWVVVAVDNKHNKDVEKKYRQTILNRIESRIGEGISPF